jgi:hypothetical protein
MSKIASFFAPEPEPEKPKTIEEQIAQYRHDYRNMLKRTATVFTLPLCKTKATFKAALTSK